MPHKYAIYETDTSIFYQDKQLLSTGDDEKAMKRPREADATMKIVPRLDGLIICLCPRLLKLDQQSCGATVL